MSRHVRIECPHCQRSDLRIRPENLGQRVKCKHCGTIFVSTAPDESPRPASPGPAAGAGADPSGGFAGTGDLPGRADWPGPAEERRRADGATRLEELLVERGRLRESQAEVEGLRADLKATQEGALRAARGMEAVAQERDRVTALLGRLERESAATRAELEAARRGQDDATRRAEEADGLARRLRDELEARPAGLAERVGLLTAERDEALARCALIDGRREALGAEVERLGRRLDELEAGGDERARQEAEADGLRAELEEARRRLGEETRRAEDLAARAGADARDREEALGRAEEAEGLVLRLRGELEGRPAEHADRVGQLAEELAAARSGRDVLAAEAAGLREALDLARSGSEGEIGGLRAELEEARRRLDEIGRLAEERGGRSEEARRLADALRQESEDRARELSERLAAWALEGESWQAERDRLRGEAAADRSGLDDQVAANADLRGRLEGLTRDLEAAAADRSRLGAEAVGLRAELEEARLRLDEVGRLAEEGGARMAEFEALVRGLRDELAGQSAASSGQIAGLTAERDAALARCDLLRDELGAEVGRLARRGEELEALRARLEGEVLGLRAELEEARRGLEEAGRRAAEAERAARGLRGEVERLEEAHRAGREEGDWAALALRREIEEARSAAVADRERAAAQGEAMSDLERRLAAALDDLGRAAGRAEVAEAEARDLRELRAGSGDDPQARVEELARQLAEARQANQRLGSLLGVFGMTKEAASLALGRVETPAIQHADPAQLPASRDGGGRHPGTG